MDLKFLIIDDHPLISLGLESVLSKLDGTIGFFSASSGKESIDLVKKHRFDLVFLDIFIPDTDTHSILHQITRIQPDLRILMFSSGNEQIYGAHYIKLGAHGFLRKDASPEEILEATRIVIKGRLYISADVVHQVSSVTKLTTPSDVFQKLSKRELEVAKLLVQGRKVVQIARILNLHTSTIGTQKSRIFQKLQVENTHEFLELCRLNSFN